MLLLSPSLTETGEGLSEGLLTWTTSWCESLKAEKLSIRTDVDDYT